MFASYCCATNILRYGYMEFLEIEREKKSAVYKEKEGVWEKERKKGIERERGRERKRERKRVWEREKEIKKRELVKELNSKITKDHLPHIITVNGVE